MHCPSKTTESEQQQQLFVLSMAFCILLS